MTTNAAKFTGNIPEHYDKGLGPVLFDHYGDIITRKTVANSPMSVLELAAGTGIVSRKLRDALDTDSTLLATDLNQPMLDVSAKKFDVGEAITFQAVDAMDLPFMDASFDAIVCQFGVMFFPDKDRSYREARRVLNKGGHYIFNVWGGWDVNPFAKHAHETIAQFFDGDAPKFYEVPFGYDDVEGISKSLIAAGFSTIDVERINHNAVLDDIPALAMALVHGNPIADEIRGLGGSPDDAVKAVESVIMEMFGETRTMPLEAISFTAKL